MMKEPTLLFEMIRGRFLSNVVFVIIHKEVVNIVYLAKINMHQWSMINELWHNSLGKYTVAFNKKYIYYV